jgi:hypothetical protein
VTCAEDSFLARCFRLDLIKVYEIFSLPLPSHRVLNINSFIKYAGAVFGAIGLILTAYLAFEDKQKLMRVTKAAVDPATPNRNLETVQPPTLQPEKY